MTSINLLLCEFCNSSKEQNNRGFVVCTNCGIVKRKRFVDHIPVKINRFGEYQGHNSQGNTLDNPKNLGSYIGRVGKSTYNIRGIRLNQKEIRKYRRLSIFYQEPAKRENNATHLRTILAFKKVVNELRLPKSIEQRSLYLYWKQVKKEKKENLTITNHILLIALCSLYAIREAADITPIRFSEVIAAFANRGHRVTNKNIMRMARELKFELIPRQRKSEDYIPRLAAQIRDDQSIQRKLQYHIFSAENYEMKLILVSNHFLSLIGRKERGGVQPYPFAVSIIYLADRVIAKFLKKRPVLTQKLLANAVNSAEFTIRDHIYRFLGEIYTNREKLLIQYIDEKFEF